MTAPDPTAGERCPEHPASPVDDPSEVARRRFLAEPVVRPTSLPAVAASTGTSEDVDLREVIRLAAEKYLSDFDTVMNVRSEARDLAVMIDRTVLASDWLAAREAAARAEIVAGVRAWCAINEIAAPPLDWEGLGEFLVRVAREGRP